MDDVEAVWFDSEAFLAIDTTLDSSSSLAEGASSVSGTVSVGAGVWGDMLSCVDASVVGSGTGVVVLLEVSGASDVSEISGFVGLSTGCCSAESGARTIGPSSVLISGSSTRKYSVVVSKASSKPSVLVETSSLAALSVTVSVSGKSTSVTSLTSVSTVVVSNNSISAAFSSTRLSLAFTSGFVAFQL